MRTVISTLTLALLIVLGGGLGWVYSGLYNIAATTPHWPITTWLLDSARVRSIKMHAANLAVPADFAASAQLEIGVDHFAAHCAVCHGAPGVPKGDIAKGLYPPAPNLALTVDQYTPAELFWILKHGIKMTGMPAWADHSDGELWATVRFLKQLPGMTEADYAGLLMTALAHGGHHHSH